MKRCLRYLLTAVWIAALTVLLVRFWYARPERFPHVLKTIGNAIVDFSGASNAEQSADIELAYLTMTALLIVVFATWLGRAWLRCFKHVHPVR